MSTTRHIEFWRGDLERLRESGIMQLRYPIPWHRIEPSPGHFDWRWIDGPMRLLEQMNFAPILDPLHHVSVPDWLDGGFANSAFPGLYARFIEAVASRYEWVERYTVFNEPLPTLVLCGLTGDWYPHCKSDRDFVNMGRNVARAICLGTQKLLAVNSGVRFFHIDSCEHHCALDSESEEWVEHANSRRFLFHDLVLGRVGKHHLLARYLRDAGLCECERQWFEDNPARIDVLGLDYYAHSEIDWCSSRKSFHPSISFPCRQPRGFAEVAQDYTERYGLPVFVAETNIGGSVRDRISWLKFMEEEAEKVACFADLRGFCWFPSIDATDWQSLCTRADKCVSPIGIWTLSDDRKTRHCSELSHWFTRLARGEARSSDLPSYAFEPPLDRDLQGYLRLMNRGATGRSYSHLAENGIQAA